MSEQVVKSMSKHRKSAAIEQPKEQEPVAAEQAAPEELMNEQASEQPSEQPSEQSQPFEPVEDDDTDSLAERMAEMKRKLDALKELQAEKKRAAERVAAEARERLRARAEPLVAERAMREAEIESAKERILAITVQLVEMGWETPKASRAEKTGFDLAVATVKSIAKKAGRVLPEVGINRQAWSDAGGDLDTPLPGAWLAAVLQGLATAALRKDEPSEPEAPEAAPKA